MTWRLIKTIFPHWAVLLPRCQVATTETPLNAPSINSLRLQAKKCPAMLTKKSWQIYASMSPKLRRTSTDLNLATSTLSSSLIVTTSTSWSATSRWLGTSCISAYLTWRMTCSPMLSDTCTSRVSQCVSSRMTSAWQTEEMIAKTWLMPGSLFALMTLSSTICTTSSWSLMTHSSSLAPSIGHSKPDQTTRRTCLSWTIPSIWSDTRPSSKSSGLSLPQMPYDHKRMQPGPSRKPIGTSRPTRPTEVARIRTNLASTSPLLATSSMAGELTLKLWKVPLLTAITKYKRDHFTPSNETP